ncbi:MAG: DUF692 domain-containing protein [Aquabacterium sp.]
MSPASHASSFIGIGLRQAHAATLRELMPPLGFLEVHAENFFADGGPALQALIEWRAHYPISLHGVGLSLGSASGVDAAHLGKLVRLARRIDPVRVSDHASFGRVAGAGQAAVHASDLLPVAFTAESQDILVRNIGQVQDALQRPILIENLSAYMAYEDDALLEVAFLADVCRRSGCQLLLDLNNLVVNGLNGARRASWQGGPPFEAGSALSQARAEALDYVWSLPPGLVGQVHLAGFRWPEQADRLFIDDHSQRISPTVWDVYEQALLHLGPVPTLIEWDVDLPPLSVLLDEVRIATDVMARAQGEPEDEAWDA